MKLVTDLLGSKKFRVTAIGIVTTLAVTLGLEPEIAKAIVPYLTAMVCSYVLGQGWADHGKERAKIEAAVSPLTFGPMATDPRPG